MCDTASHACLVELRQPMSSGSDEGDGLQFDAVDIEMQNVNQSGETHSVGVRGKHHNPIQLKHRIGDAIVGTWAGVLFYIVMFTHVGLFSFFAQDAFRASHYHTYRVAIDVFCCAVCALLQCDVMRLFCRSMPPLVFIMLSGIVQIVYGMLVLFGGYLGSTMRIVVACAVCFISVVWMCMRVYRFLRRRSKK